MMCPQLFINYKLQSVAHMPWRQMTYKFLNTIIDDLFAFVIKMPLLHRLSVFRDGKLLRSPNNSVPTHFNWLSLRVILDCEVLTFTMTSLDESC